MGNNLKKSALAMGLSASLALGSLLASVEPSFANVSNSKITTFETNLTNAIAALQKQSFSSASARDAAVQSLIAKQQKDGVLVLGAVTFALLVAALLLVELHTSVPGCPNPSPS